MEFTRLNRGRHERPKRTYFLMRHGTYYEETEALSLDGFDEVSKAVGKILEQLPTLFPHAEEVTIHLYSSSAYRAKNTAWLIAEHFWKMKKNNGVELRVEIEVLKWLASDTRQITDENINQQLDIAAGHGYRAHLCGFISHQLDLEEYAHQPFDKGDLVFKEIIDE